MCSPISFNLRNQEIKSQMNSLTKIKSTIKYNSFDIFKNLVLISSFLFLNNLYLLTLVYHRIYEGPRLSNLIWHSFLSFFSNFGILLCAHKKTAKYKKTIFILILPCFFISPLLLYFTHTLFRFFPVLVGMFCCFILIKEKNK